MKHIKRVSVEKANILPTDLQGLINLLLNPAQFIINVIKDLFGLDDNNVA